MVATASRPRAVAIIVDIPSDQLSSLVIAAVGNVVKSLSPNDMVGTLYVLSEIT